MDEIDKYLKDKEETVMKTLAMPVSLKGKISDLAAEKGTSETKVINSILRAYFENKEKEG